MSWTLEMVSSVSSWMLAVVSPNDASQNENKNILDSWFPKGDNKGDEKNTRKFSFAFTRHNSLALHVIQRELSVLVETRFFFGFLVCRSPVCRSVLRVFYNFWSGN